MTPQTLEKISFLMYGNTWQTRLAKEMKVSRSAVRAWLKGKANGGMDITQEREEQFYLLLATHIKKLLKCEK